MIQALDALKATLKGELFTDNATRIIYATDGSVYREKPLAVAWPKDEDDLKELIRFARLNSTSLIPRTAGTSLAGQVVGNGIVVDVSKYMTEILEINPEEKWVRVQPGVILDHLNFFLKDYGLFFGPETSTSSRCMMGGMVGNNSCGAHLPIYGSTREHTLSVKALLSDGSEVLFEPLSAEAFHAKTRLNTLEGRLYRHIQEMLENPVNRNLIRDNYPKPTIPRRNMGYALDILMEMQPFNPQGKPFNFSSLLAGSEGTLAFFTEITLGLVPLPPRETAVVCCHFEKLEEAFHANLIALKYKPGAVELMDRYIMDCTKNNIGQRKNRFFLQGNPAALMMVEFRRDSRDELDALTNAMEKEMRAAGYGYAFPVLCNDMADRVWELRKAGLGLLSNIPGDTRSVTVIEDTAVDVEDLPAYMKEFDKILKKYGKESVYYAHIGSGELHLRPIINLKDCDEVEIFRSILMDVAQLVKKYRGSLSGEHGDGRLRGEMIPLMIGDHNYRLLRQLKFTWDPNNLFNPGKIVDTPLMNTHLRYEPGLPLREVETVFDFSRVRGFVRAAEKCNGSGDCRKTEVSGGTMCPSYMATRDEHHVTRARANILREFLTYSPKDDPLDHEEIYGIMDLCLSCKACKSECPSGVDVAKLKAEFLQHYYDLHGAPFRSKLIANITKLNRLGSLFPGLTNFFFKTGLFRKPFMSMIGFSVKRTLPLLHTVTLERWMRHYVRTLQKDKGKRRVYLFNDEFTNFQDTPVGIDAIRLLTRLGYDVKIPRHKESARASLSKGFLRKAKVLAEKNVSMLKELISEESPLIGLEPSAILTFRDEYPELVGEELKEDAKKLANHVLMIEEFLVLEMDAGRINRGVFTTEEKHILLHGHCQQKAVASTAPTLKMLAFPENYKVKEIPSGCCGMAGSFGYEKEHYEVSMKVGELVLFPSVRNASPDTIIAAPGTSCRHQIKDGTGRTAYHPVEILYQALKK
ncbi:MAG: FAD-binding protein [Candidatus Marinimicrobia bacterium]|nr:FAD-binding protein [Candidatus Neomarinimicrobiota bacterium]